LDLVAFWRSMVDERSRRSECVFFSFSSSHPFCIELQKTWNKTRSGASPTEIDSLFPLSSSLLSLSLSSFGEGRS